MQPKALEINEPIVLALVDAVTAWQAALEQTLSVSGLTYPKWLLLRAIHTGTFRRGLPLSAAVFMDVAQTERLLNELREEGWLAFEANGAPRIAASAAARLDRAGQGVKALHSVSVGQFNAEERVALTGLLHRMTGTLQDHAERHRRNAAWERSESSVVVPPEVGRAALRAVAA
ncbi:hypothetical protein SAMN05216321_102251 [Cupriavidus sp. OV038]|jgi:hypothetical protein|uniref:MarR family transcriptional regulator n=1 Tax=unclassified Cupriavidus TaxID=2640874 RepID=UPI0008E701E8|nr:MULTISPECIES: MarR family transcriptional regulator [unclassified Cupriavidus]SFB94199.1 hypothetical protein SAMN05216321_102251 [Cupriavidus sp. OV038]SFO95984.1 hypothetical protein SAMN05216322_103365 [Cupriavidus sp. OV096]